MIVEMLEEAADDNKISVYRTKCLCLFMTICEQFIFFSFLSLSSSKNLCAVLLHSMDFVVAVMRCCSCWHIYINKQHITLSVLIRC